VRRASPSSPRSSSRDLVRHRSYRMIPGVRGRLISVAFAQTELALLPGIDPLPRHVARDVEVWSSHREAAFGPASSIRAVTDGVVLPLLTVLGFGIGARVDRVDHVRFDATWSGRSVATVVVVGWEQSLNSARRISILNAIAADARWCLC